MGGRGASSGFSKDKSGAVKNQYGTQYHTIFQSGNIKFVRKNDRTSETLMETQTSGRVYVSVGGSELQSITYFDKANKRSKTIHLDHPHKGEKPHTHHGYFHAEYDGPKGFAKLNSKEKQMVDRIQKLWYTYLNK